MYPVSSGFLTALQAPSMTVGVLVTASDGTTLAVQDGSVQMDSRRDITRTCDLELIPAFGKTASDVYNLVMSPGLEITVRRGLLVNGAYEYVPLGVFSTDTAEYSKAAGGTVRWSGSDRSKRISRAKFTDFYPIASGTTLAAAVTALLQSRYSATQTNFSNVTEALSAQVVYEAGEGSDPWASARALFADYGYDLNFDGLGVARAVNVLDPSASDTVFDFGAGQTNLVTGGDVQGTLEATYNGVIVTGEGSQYASPYRADVWDTDPGSPTYWQSGFGPVPMFHSSPLLTSNDACQAAATAMLAKVKGRTDQFTWPSVVNPALEPLDVVTVTLDGVTSRLVIDSLTIPLKAVSEMSAVARQVVTY